MNNKINIFFSLFKKLFLKIKYGSHCRIGKRFKAKGANIVITNKNGFLVFGDSFKAMKNSTIHSDGGKIRIGNNVFINSNSLIVSRDCIEIGNNVSIGPNSCIYDHNHRDERIDELGSVKIGNNVWIGAGVIILKGVSIGENAIIGAGTIVTKNISAHSVVYQKRENIIIKSKENME